jgi:hypothetical protein
VDWEALTELDGDTTNLEAIARRAFLRDSAMGLGSIALASLLQSKGHTANVSSKTNGGVLKQLHLPARVKRVIFLFMAGGPSHVDLFDPKPLLNEMDGKKIPPHLLKDHQSFALIRGTPSLKGSPYSFAPRGQSDWSREAKAMEPNPIAESFRKVRRARACKGDFP